MSAQREAERREDLEDSAIYALSGRLAIAEKRVLELTALAEKYREGLENSLSIHKEIFNKGLASRIQDRMACKLCASDRIWDAIRHIDSLLSLPFPKVEG